MIQVQPAVNPPHVASETIAWISCDECQNWFHQDCVAIESSDIEGTWYCNSCIQKSVCQSCFLAEPSDETDEEVLWIACDRCKSWYHTLCVEQIDVSKEWFCSLCM